MRYWISCLGRMQNQMHKHIEVSNKPEEWASHARTFAIKHEAQTHRLVQEAGNTAWSRHTYTVRSSDRRLLAGEEGAGQLGRY